MKYKLGGQRPLDIRDIRAGKRPSIVGTLFVLPLVLLLLLPLVVHAAFQTMANPGLGLAIAVGLGSAVVGVAVVAVLPGPTPDAPK